MSNSKSNNNNSRRSYQLVLIALIAVAAVAIGGIGVGSVDAAYDDNTDYDYTLVELTHSSNTLTQPDDISFTIKNQTDSKRYTLNRSERYVASGYTFAYVQSDISNPTVSNLSNSLDATGSRVSARSTKPLIRTVSVDEETSILSIEISTNQSIDWTDHSFVVDSGSHTYTEVGSLDVSSSGSTLSLSANASEQSTTFREGDQVIMVVRPDTCTLSCSTVYYNVTDVSSSEGPLIGGVGSGGGSILLYAIIGIGFYLIVIRD